jgi:hypothetical protein
LEPFGAPKEIIMPEICLNETPTICRKSLHGGTYWTAMAGERIRLQDKPQGGDIEDVFDETVPTGKKWQISILIDITETDA